MLSQSCSMDFQDLCTVNTIFYLTLLYVQRFVKFIIVKNLVILAKLFKLNLIRFQLCYKAVAQTEDRQMKKVQKGYLIRVHKINKAN